MAAHRAAKGDWEAPEVHRAVAAKDEVKEAWVAARAAVTH